MHLNNNSYSYHYDEVAYSLSEYIQPVRISPYVGGLPLLITDIKRVGRGWEGEVHSYFLKTMYINRVVSRVPIILNTVPN